MTAPDKSTRCEGHVYYRDCLRYTGRIASGFEREWTWRQCKRLATIGAFCYQHAPSDAEQEFANHMHADYDRERAE